VSIKKIRTVLINPYFSIQDRYGKDMKNFGAISEPLGLAYLAANLEKNNYPVSIIDAPALNINNIDIARQLKEEPPDIVGITVLTPMHGTVKDLVKRIKEVVPYVKIIVGGAHASALPAELLSEIEEIDYVCIGEGEDTIIETVKFIESEKEFPEIAGLAYRKNGKAVVGKPRLARTNLDEIPSPARHLLPMEKYNLTVSKTKGVGYCPTLIVARGCPFDCYYCSHPFGRSFRHHSVERILNEKRDCFYRICDCPRCRRDAGFERHDRGKKGETVF